MRNKRNSPRQKVNIKARINRHLRIGRQQGSRKIRGINYSVVFVLCFITLLLPIYPGLANAFYRNTEVDFYRGDIDKSSIINSYDYRNSESEQESYLAENVDAFVSVDTILEGKRNTTGSNEIVDYPVKPGDSYQSIAKDFGISVNSILWANNFSSSHVIHPGDRIKVPPVTGLVYTVKKGDNLEKVALKYDIDVKTVEKQNKMDADDMLKVGQILMLPGAKKIIPKPKKVVVPQKVAVSNTSARGAYSKDTSYTPPSSVVSSSGRYALSAKGGYNRFVAGNCTWFVRKYKNVTWGGNANMWITNARAQGYTISNTPKAGSILQLTGRGYNPRYGHVAIVLQVNGNTMEIVDMNYSGLYQVTYRNMSIYHPAIDGYIYVD